MKIGVITYYKINNFGANLQAVSTYLFLKKAGHDPIFINYMLDEAQDSYNKGLREDVQWQTHIKFVDSIIKTQTPLCKNAEEVISFVKQYKMDAIVVGSDALLQHHPFITRIKRARRKIFYIQNVTSDRRFPNLFWGCGLADKVPMALMSVSSQNSEYDLFLKKTKKAMKATLLNMKYISVRDSWTRDMLLEIMNKDFSITPDPVFAFNQNASHLVPSKEEIIKKFELPEKYVLLSLFSQVIPIETILDIKKKLLQVGFSLVVLPLPIGVKFQHNVDYEISRPLSPIDWYALLKYSSGYVGSNMHPIVSCLHNAIPCFSIDNWGRKDFWGNNKNDGSSKVEHILKVFGVEKNHRQINQDKCVVSADEIVKGLLSFPREQVQAKAEQLLDEYNLMMTTMLKTLLKP